MPKLLGKIPSVSTTWAISQRSVSKFSKLLVSEIRFTSHSKSIQKISNGRGRNRAKVIAELFSIGFALLRSMIGLTTNRKPPATCINTVVQAFDLVVYLDFNF